MPTMDVAARKGFVRPTDGTNYQAMLDDKARKGFVQITDGTNNLPVIRDDPQLVPDGIVLSVASLLQGYDRLSDSWRRMGGIFDHKTERFSIATSRAAGKSTFTEEYGTDISEEPIIIPEEGLRLMIVGILTAMDSDSGDILLDFAGTGIKVWRHYGAKFKTQHGMDMSFIGDTDEPLILTSTQGENKIFILINYREID